MWKNLTDLHTFGINWNGSCKPSPIAQHLVESIPRNIEAVRKNQRQWFWIDKFRLQTYGYIVQSVSFQYNCVTVIANAKWFQHLKMGHFPNQSRLRNTTEPQKMNISEIRHVEILRVDLMVLDWCLVVFRFGFQSFSSLLQSLLLRTPVNILNFSKH